MVKTFCDLCGQQLTLPVGMIHYGTKLPFTMDGRFKLDDMDLCRMCWTELQAWVDMKLKKLVPEDPKK